ncbi:MAG: carboxylesterase [Cardiobacteriaceae bacterium]|nr:carboxylesterase [Cardiobacteriaceae bacterium]
MTQRLERITLPAEKNATHSIIWLHGLGADGNDFSPIVTLLNLRATTRIIFPHAPIRAITVNQGYRMRAWYDITDFSFEQRDEDITGIKESAAQILDIAKEEYALGIAQENLLYAGFSQGGALALYLGLRHNCAGILALSTYLVDRDNTPPANCEHCPPILQMHGTQDPVVPYTLGKISYELLKHKGYAAEWKDYPMQHQVCPPQIHDIATWLHTQGF